MRKSRPIQDRHDYTQQRQDEERPRHALQVERQVVQSNLPSNKRWIPSSYSFHAE